MSEPIRFSRKGIIGKSAEEPYLWYYGHNTSFSVLKFMLSQAMIYIIKV